MKRRAWRLDAAEDRDEPRLPHERQHPLVLGDVERRLAGEPQRIPVRALPFDQVGQELERRLLVADEVVVDEVDTGRSSGHDLVELGQHLGRRLEPRILAIERGDVAELARVRAAARELDVSEEVPPDRRQVIGRHREVGQGQARGRLEA